MYFLILLFVIILTSLFLSYRYFFSKMQTPNKSKKNSLSAEPLLNKKSLLSLSSFIFLTVCLYFGLGRPDLLQRQLPQKKLELSLIQTLNDTKDANENEKLLLLYSTLKEALVKKPGDIRGYSLLVKTCLNLNKYSEARLAQEKVLSLKKSASNIDDYALLMDTYLIAAGGRFSIEASKILKKIKNKYPSNENTYFFIALEHLERKEYQPAIKVYKNLKAQNILKTEKLILLENKLKIIGYSN